MICGQVAMTDGDNQSCGLKMLVSWLSGVAIISELLSLTISAPEGFTPHDQAMRYFNLAILQQ